MKLASRWSFVAALGLIGAVMACDDTHGDLAVDYDDAAAGAGGSAGNARDASAAAGGAGGAGNTAGLDAAVAGAGGRDGAAPGGQVDAAQDAQVLAPSPKLDVLLVIDNSNSMQEEQAAIRPAFGELVRALRGLPAGLPDLHIGIVSTDLGAGPTILPGNPACNRRQRIGGDRGELLVKEGCGLDGTRARFLSVSDGGATRNFDGNLADVVGCLAAIGTGGCGFEHQLLATQLALDTTVNPVSAGFLRQDADLLIVIVSDEDDCSANPSTTELFSAPSTTYPSSAAGLRCAYEGHLWKGQRLQISQPFRAPLAEMSAGPGGTGERDLVPVPSIVDEVKKKKPGRRVLVAAIVGWNDGGGEYSIQNQSFAGQELLDLQPLCRSSTGAAAPALRIKGFVDGFGARGRIESLCNPDWQAKFARIGELVRTAP